ncbi:MAG TPA: helix-turn-helix transcriptional regulator [Desulfuromonadales bacterium]|nr:helix-turn-helix transcriptional regulator [Desulfuromonadales bacterium]
MSIITLRNTPHEALLTLATFVKTVRLNQEMTLEELAARTGVSRSSLIRLEKQGAGSTETQVKVLAALGVLDQLVSALEPPEKQLSIAELKKLSTRHQRQRGRRRTSEIS